MTVSEGQEQVPQFTLHQYLGWQEFDGGLNELEPETLDSESIQVHKTPSHSLSEVDMTEVIHTYTYTWKAEHA